MKFSLRPIFILLVLFFALPSLACGGSNTGEKVGEVSVKPSSPTSISDTSESVESNSPTNTAPSKMQLYKVGDVIEVEDHTITLNSVDVKGTVLVATFTFINTGTDEINTSSLLSYEAKDMEGSKLEQEFFDCGSSSLDGKILAGDRLKGSICFSGASSTATYRIYYQSSLFGSGATVWEVTPEDYGKEELAAPIDETSSQPETLFKVSDIVEVGDQIILLNKVNIVQNILMATFTIINNGTDEINSSTMLGLDARDAEGSNLEQEYFDCGSSLDGKILPGDRLKGEICWNGASPDKPYKLYYEASLFGSGAVVWQVTPEEYGKEEVASPAVDISKQIYDLFKVGDIIELTDHKITLNNAVVSGNILKANFTIENTGTSDVNVSSMLSFYAKDSDGVELEQEYFDCSSSGLDGTIIGGDLLKGDICWKVGVNPDIRLYYENELFGSGAVVWTILP